MIRLINIFITTLSLVRHLKFILDYFEIDNELWLSMVTLLSHKSQNKTKTWYLWTKIFPLPQLHHNPSLQLTPNCYVLLWWPALRDGTCECGLLCPGYLTEHSVLWVLQCCHKWQNMLFSNDWRLNSTPLCFQFSLNDLPANTLSLR